MEVTTSIKINKSKADLFNSRKEIEKLQKEKKKLEEGLVRAEEKAMKNYKSSDQFADNLAEESLRVFYEGFEDCKKKLKEFLPNFNITFLILSIGILVEIEKVVEDTAKDIGAPIEDLALTTFVIATVAKASKIAMDT